MIPIIAALLSVASASPLARIDVLSATPSPWLFDEAPLITRRPLTSGVRLLGQVSATWQLPATHWSLGTSFVAQELCYSRPLPVEQLSWVVAAQTRLLIPSGVRAGLRLRVRNIHLETGVLADSGSRWAAPRPDRPTLHVTAAMGIWLPRQDSPPRKR